jgi:TIR domain
MTEESKAFFSYSRLDAEFALKLAKDLRNAGAAIWIDQLDIAPGSHWDIAVQKAVGGSSSLLVVLSPHAVESENVMDEVAYAIEEKKLVIPVLYRKCDIPLRLRRLQYIDVQADYEGGVQKIVTQLRAHQESAGSSATQSPRATTAEWDTAQARAEAQAREREQAAKAAEVRAAQERIARTNAERVAQQQAVQPTNSLRAATAGGPSAPSPPAESRSSKKVIWAVVAGSIFILLLIVVIASMSNHRTQEIPTTASSATEPSSTPAGAEPVHAVSQPSSGQNSSGTDARPDLHQWLLDSLSASQGPSVDALRPYFDETVSPYYSMPSADWAQIAADKEAYFNRFPEIHYQLLMWKHTPQPDGSEEIEYDVSYREVRSDGVLAHGVSHSVATVRFKDGVWKITSIR